MAWDEQHKKVAIKVIGTVESNMDYGAINYNDPVTVGIAQWFGTRAAGLLHSIRNTQQWQQKMNGSTLDINGLSRHTASDPWWNTFYLSRAYDVSLRECLKANSATQDALLVKDIEGYTATATQYGLDYNNNTDAFILWACAYHQSPRQALRVLMRGGGGMGLRALYAAIIADGVLGQYKTRYEKAYAIISSGDTSGVGSGGGASGAGLGNGTAINANGNQEITIEGGELVVQTDNSNVMFAQTKFGNVNLYPCGINAWKASLNDIKTVVNVAVEQAAAQSGGGDGGGGGAGDGSAGAKAPAWMKSRIMKFVADVSSSMSNVDAPAATAFMRFAACDVEPEAFAVINDRVSVPDGRLLMNGEISTPVTGRPSSARIVVASARVITHSRPSPAICGYTPCSIACNNVDLPW